MVHAPLIAAGIFGMTTTAWWLSAPWLAHRADPRMRQRNPAQHARIVRFYRGWGCAAIALGICLALTS